MNRIFLTTILLSITSLMIMSQEKEVSYSSITVRVPYSWNASCKDVATFAKMISITDAEPPTFIYILSEYDFQSESLEYSFESLIKNNNTELYKDAIWEELEYTTVANRKAIKANYSKVFLGEQFECTAYCTLTERNIYTFIFMNKKGSYDHSANILKSIRIDDSKTKYEKYRSGREEVRAFHDGMIKAKGFGREVAEGITFDNIDVSDIEDNLIYEYTILLVDINQCTEEEKEEIRKEIRNGMLDSIKDQVLSYGGAKRCVDEGFGVIVKIYDKNKQIITTLRYSNSDLH